MMHNLKNDMEEVCHTSECIWTRFYEFICTFTMCPYCGVTAAVAHVHRSACEIKSSKAAGPL